MILVIHYKSVETCEIINNKKYLHLLLFPLNFLYGIVFIFEEDEFIKLFKMTR